MGTLDDVANAAEYLASDLAGSNSAEHLLVGGGVSICGALLHSLTYDPLHALSRHFWP